MQSSKLPYQKWGLAIYIVATTVKGVSSIQLHKHLQVRQPTAWYLAQRIRQGFVEGFEQMKGPIEVDEAYIGGINKWRHRDKKGTIDKTIVAGVKDRSTGKVVAKVVNRVDANTMLPIIDAARADGATVYTDEHRAYTNVTNHLAVNHSGGEYVDGDVHVNGVECFWSHLKRGIKGTYMQVSRKHLGRYVDEFAGRQNRRLCSTLEKMLLLVQGMDCGVLGQRRLSLGMKPVQPEPYHDPTPVLPV